MKDKNDWDNDMNKKYKEIKKDNALLIFRIGVIILMTLFSGVFIYIIFKYINLRL